MSEDVTSLTILKAQRVAVEDVQVEQVHNDVRNREAEETGEQAPYLMGRESHNCFHNERSTEHTPRDI